MSNQQDEAKEFFDSYSKEWKNSASFKDGIIQQRNNFVMSIAKNFFKGKLGSYLDAGCGTGDLLIEMKNLCEELTGIDFAPKMIDEAEKSKRQYSLSNCNFLVDDALNFKNPNGYDLISANGFIEYISFEQLKEFLKNSKNNLTDNGIISIGSRNRLFNLITFNEFTLDEYLDLNNAKTLAEEAVQLSAANFNLDSFTSQRASTKYQKAEYTHPKTGVKVSQRFQYTPLQLANLLTDLGFKILEIGGCNFHQMPIISNEKDFIPPSKSYAHLPYCSTFMIAARKILP